jgi:hypothetical protein
MYVFLSLFLADREERSRETFRAQSFSPGKSIIPLSFRLHLPNFTVIRWRGRGVGVACGGIHSPHCFFNWAASHVDLQRRIVPRGVEESYSSLGVPHPPGPCS